MGLIKILAKVLFLILVKVGDLALHVLKNIRKTVKTGLPGRKEVVLLQVRRTRTKKPEQKKQTRKIKNNGFLFLRIKFFILGVVFSFLFLFLPLLFFVFVADLPDPYNLSLNSIPKTTKIYDRNGNLLYEIYINQNRSIVKLADIPKHLKLATIAVEDRNFYNHPGFDIRAVLRAALVNLRGTDFQGGSTITQQLVKIAFLSAEPTIQRKIKEVALAFWVERIYSKDKILELYLNYAPYGGTAWGVEAASEIYFGKPVKDLDLAESAFLAGLTRAPSIYSPFASKNPNLWKRRQKEVLSAMVAAGFISQKQAERAEAEVLTFRTPNIPLLAPHFVMFMKDLLVQKYGLSEVERGGLTVRTTLDLSIQKMAEEAVKEEVAANSYLNIKNGAALITNPKNGDILAMVGNTDFYNRDIHGEVNIATSLRQPGSSIKIVTYTLALSSGFTEATILDDSPFSIKLPNGEVYSPVNYDGKFHGRLPLRLAFANSLNIPAVRVAQVLGVPKIVEFGKKMGITSWGDPRQYGLSITLGGADTTMLDMATVYGTVANGGERVDLDPILEVRGAEGKILYKKQPQAKRVVDPGVAFIISDILSDDNARSLEFGLGSPLNIPGHRVSVKTGTSDNKRDNWTIGFTRDYVVASWVGNYDNSPMSQYLASGITGAAPIFNRIMSNLLEGKEEEPLAVPPNIVVKNCLGRTAYFLSGTQNSVSCALPSITPTPTK
jgi:1A family penicillin-binding protein